MLDNKNDSFENTKKYKKTAIGIIPNEWTAKTFDEIALKSNKKYNPLTDNNDCKCIELEHIQQQTGILLGYCSAKKQASIKNTFSVNDVLYSKLRPYLRKFYFANFNGVCSSEIWVLKPQSEITNKYLFYIVQSDRFNSVCNGSCIGSKMPRADYDYISQYLFAVPPLEEQKKIAEILSTQDRVIELKEKLISEKQRQKKYLMQQLLTGRIRLKGFNGEWKKTILSEVCEFTNGIAHEKDVNEDGRYIICNSKFISSEGKVRKYTNLQLCPCDIGDILMVMSDVPNGKAIAKCFFVDISDKYTVNQRICIIRIKKGYKKYFYYLINRNKYYLSFDNGVGQTNLRKEDVLSLIVKLPTYQEQIAIANVLSIADQEIDLLQKELEQEKQKKKALMQLLLTGIVRV